MIAAGYLLGFTCNYISLHVKFQQLQSLLLQHMKENNIKTASLDSLITGKSRSLKKSQAKAVSFHPVVITILIPSLPEYEEAQLTPRIWWKRRDLERIRRKFYTSFNKFCESLDCANVKREVALEMFLSEDPDEYQD